MIWYGERSTVWRMALVGGTVEGQFLSIGWVSIGMWRVMSKKGGLGCEERITSAERKRAAEK